MQFGLFPVVMCVGTLSPTKVSRVPIYLFSFPKSFASKISFSVLGV